MRWGLSLTLVALSLAGCRAAFCTPKTGESTKPLPSLDVPAFTTEYRAIIKDKKYTQWAKESYDSVNNKLRLDVVESGLQSTLLIDYGIDAYVQIEYHDQAKENVSTCVIQALDQIKDDNLDMFGFKIKPNSAGANIRHIVSSSQVLQLANSTGVEYKGETDIDGLKVDHFQSCLTWKDVNATFLLDYYFTTTDFQPRDAMTPKQIPVRAEVKGEILRGSKTVNFEHTYEYLDFRVFPYLPLETFGLPEFVVCYEIVDVWKRPFPVIPGEMSYTVETVTKSQAGDVDVKLSHVHISTQWRLIRVDQARSSSIYDFSTGMEYLMDDNGCSTGPIDHSHLDWVDESVGISKMKDRPELSYLKQDFFYAGFAKYRELLVHSYSATVGDEAIQAYISIDGVTPLGLHVKNRKDATSIYYNIFNFDPASSRSMENPFDIQRCVDNSKIQDYSMKVKTRYTYSYLNLKNITAELRNKAAEVAEVSPLQIIHKDIINQGDDLYWTFRILGKNSQVSVRAKVENPIGLKSKDDISPLIYFAVFNGNFTFNLFYDTYYASKVPFTGIDVSSSFTWYKMTVDSDLKYSYEYQPDKCVKRFKDKAELSSKHNAHECAQACADSRESSCTYFEYVELTKACQLSWSPEAPDVVNGNGCKLFRRGFIYDFIAFPGAVLKKEEGVSYRRAEDAEACAKLCIEETGFQCESFDYCGNDKRCQINKSHYFSDESNPKTGDNVVEDCMHYSRSYDDYDEYFNKDFDAPEYVTFTSSDYYQCSYMCSKDEDGCMAFTFCWPELKRGWSEGICKLLPSSQANKVTFKSLDDSSCSLSIAPGIQNRKPGDQPRTLEMRSADNGTRYGGGAMFGLALAMLAIGAAVTALAVFLLRHFKIWEGF